MDSTGTPTTDVPEGIGNSFNKTGGLYGLYVQDEWHILPTVTINGGLRFDGVDEFTQENQVSPRLNVVWKPTATTTVYGGYARYFVPPPFELVSPGTITQFVGTTAAPEVTQNDPVKAERSNYFDVGVSQIVVPGPDGRHRCLLQDLEQPDRRGPVRRADHPDRVQLRAWSTGGRAAHRQLRPRSVVDLWQPGVVARPGQGHHLGAVQFRRR